MKCIKCGSEEIEEGEDLDITLFVTTGVPLTKDEYKCKKCGHEWEE